MRSVFFAAIFGVCAVGAAFAVPVHINSGDPAFPFPQFLPYVHPNGDTLHNLATKNPAGVVHAEMEKSTRDAYAIMMNRAVYEGSVALKGTRYIKYNSNPFCSEGTGYALLAAAMMADKTTFDGLWLYTHDYAMNKVTRYIDGKDAPTYSYSVLPDWTNSAGGNSAADGDFDIALALMIAHVQWGEFMGITDSRNRPISYKADFIQVLKGLSDTLSYSNGNLLSGDIGLDGYFKGGDSWAEFSGWAASAPNLASIGINNKRVEQPGPAKQHIDYTAPAYFRQFADYLKQENASAYAWNIRQFERAEASSDWLFGKLIGQDQRNIPFAGWVELTNDTTPVFTSFSDGEDFRAAWRTILSYVWHGNPKDSWDPVSKTVIRNRENTHQRDAGLRFSRFLWDRRQSPWNQQCEALIKPVAGNWWGPSMLRYYYSPQGERLADWWLNWVQGTGSPSAVTAQDTNLMAEMYRQSELEWDVETPGDRYLTSTPFYFHGFFRVLGMNVLTGNHHAPMNMKRSANMKVYVDVDRTYAFENDTITYTIDYRNYGAEDALGVVIMNRLDPDFKYVSSTGGGSLIGNSIRWNIGAVPGFKTAAGVDPTKGSVSFKAVIPNAKKKRYDNRAEIACTNGSGWVSNEYPNKISAVMKRTGVDIAKRALQVKHSVVRDVVNPGMDVTYTIEFENSAEAGWLNGGRPGVNFTYGHGGTLANAAEHKMQIRIFNDAHEAYIDYGNYRMSYFLFDNNYSGLASAGVANGWSAVMTNNIPDPVEKAKANLRHENIAPGEDANGRWNQRLILQVANPEDPARSDTNWATMAAPSQFLLNYDGLDNRVHRGISTPFLGVYQTTAGNYANRNWGGDWSFNSKVTVNTADWEPIENWGFPVSPDFTESYDPDYAGKPVTSRHRKHCAPVSTTVSNVLVEEYDGYTWRRVFGNGPVPGREVTNVVIRDTLPAGVTFKNFTGANPLGIAPKINTAGTVITWEIDKLLVGQGGKIQYVATANASQPILPVTIPNRAWISGDRESAISGNAALTVTLDELPPPPPPPTSMYKTANKGTYMQGDTINYTIAYKQTHGYPVKSTSNSQWTGSGQTNVSADGQTIDLSSAANVRFAASSGVNGTITGTVHTTPYVDPFYIVVRGGAAEIKFYQDYPGVYVIYSPTGKTPDTTLISAPDKPTISDFKIILRADSMLLWVGDTSVPIPYKVITGIAAQAGTAGVRFPTPQWGSHSVTGWTSHFDAAYNVTIKDTIPFGVTYVQGSAVGAINTGALAPRALTGAPANNVITWPVVSGMDNPLGANDSLTVTWKGVVDTAKNRTIPNTAYADLLGYPENSIGAQLLSRFALDSADVEPDDSTDVDPPDSLKAGLAVSANPVGGIFSKGALVTLASSVPGADIYYTTNGSAPDLASISTVGYGGPLVLDAAMAVRDTVTLRAAAWHDDYEPSDVVTFKYEPLRTVPVLSAVFFDDVGDGRAHGVKIALDPVRAVEFNEAVVMAHLDLIKFDGVSAAIASLRFAGDTVAFLFSGAGIDVPPDAALTISEPVLPGPYTSAHGYLVGRTLAVMDGVAPVIVKAVYRRSSNEEGGPVAGDTLVVTFSKHAEIASRTGEIVPFTLSYGQGAYRYQLRLEYNGRGEDNTVYFLVRGIDGDIRPQGDMVQQGDSIRINAASGQISNIDSRFTQKNEHNRAVPLYLQEPEVKYEYEVKTGPNPFRGVPVDSLRIWVYMKEYAWSAFEKLGQDENIYVRIFDMMGNVAAQSGKNLIMRLDPLNSDRYLLVWNGHNRNGRRAGTGTYMVVAVVTDPNGNKHTFKHRVYLRSR